MIDLSADIKRSSALKNVTLNTFYQLFGKFGSMLITVFATVLITRIYGKDGYGLFSIMQGWPALFFVISDFGINAIAAKKLSEDFQLASKYISNIFVIRTVLSLILILITSVIVFFLPYTPYLRLGVFLSSFLILTQSLYATSNIIFQVKYRYDLSTIGYLLGYLFLLGIILFLSGIEADVMWVSFSYVIGGLVTVIINFLLIRRLGVNPGLYFDLEFIKRLVLQSLPLGLMFIFSQISFKIDQLLLSALPLPEERGLTNEQAVAIYSLPYKVFEVALVVPTFFMNSVYPILVRHLMVSKEKMVRSFRAVLISLLGMSFLVSIVGIAFSDIAVRFLGGEEFMQSSVVLRVLLAGLLIYYTTQPLSWFIVTLGHQKYLPTVYLVGAVFNFTANYFLIPIYSYNASMFITHATELIILVLLCFFAKKSWDNVHA